MLSRLNDILYSGVLILLLLGGGLYFTLATRFAQFRLIKDQFRCITEKSGSGVSPFQALSLSTASRVGTGNIIGVAGALCLGGFGSVFWMWVIALISGATSLIESTLAQLYQQKDKSGCYGGPAYYIERGLRCRPLAVAFAVALLLTYGVGFNMLTSYNLQSTFAHYAFYDERITPWIIGGIAAILVFVCASGGGGRLLKVVSLLVPVMGIAYVLVALTVVLTNLPLLPYVLQRIFTEAFDLKAIFGGFAGSCLLYGVKRGIFSNEAGVGSAPNAAAAVESDHPVKQGLVQTLSVFIDTLVICSATAFMCMCSGVEPSPALAGAPYVQAALRAALGAFGPTFITVAMTLFAFTTMLGNLFYVDGNLRYLLRRPSGKRITLATRTLYCLLILIGAAMSADVLWSLGDLMMGVMILINLPAVLALRRPALKALADYDGKRRPPKSPHRSPRDLHKP